MRRCFSTAFSVLTMLVSGESLSAQCQMAFNISVYSGEFFSDDYSMAYAQSNAIDNSTLCTCAHGSYQSTIEVYSPSGRYSSSSQIGIQSSVSIPTYDELGNFIAVRNQGLYCSCVGPVQAGGPASAFYCAVPVNYQQPSPGYQQDSSLQFAYTWASSTGRAQLSRGWPEMRMTPLSTL